MSQRQTHSVDPDATPRPSTRTRKVEVRPPSPEDSGPNWDPAADVDDTGDTREDEADVDRLWKAVTATLPAVPKSYKFPSNKERPSTSSRQASEGDLNYTPRRRLDKVVPHWDMMTTLSSELQTRLRVCADQLPDDHPVWSQLDMSTRCAYLPNGICTENDTALWIHCAILRPAIAVLHCLRNGQMNASDFPNVSSVGWKPPIPDSILFALERSITGGAIAMEFKRHDVLEDWVAELDRYLRLQKALRSTGRAAKFHWPKDTHGLKKSTNILVQLWGQMENWNTHFMFLSSYAHTYLLARPNDQSTTLFVSKAYTPEDGELLAATIAFMAVATGDLPHKELKLTRAKMDHWPNVFSSQAGLDPTTYETA